MTEDERWTLRRKMTRLHRRAQKAEAALAHERAKYQRLCERVRAPGNHIAMLRPLIQALSGALGVRGIRSMYGAHDRWSKDAAANNVIMQILDSLRTVNAAMYEHWHDIYAHTPMLKKAKK